MCGIIGFTGRKPAKDILIDGLERLEYRGYDSAGIALLNDDDTLTIRKKAGRVSELRNCVRMEIIHRLAVSDIQDGQHMVELQMRMRIRTDVEMLLLSTMVSLRITVTS